jgi:hypothetical protein
MTSAVQFRNTDVRLSQALAATQASLGGRDVTLRELLASVGEQGLLVFCALLGTPFLLPVSLPGMSTALGTPMMLVGIAIVLNRVPWLPQRVLEYTLTGETVQHVLDRATHAASRFEHLVKPRLTSVTSTPAFNRLHGLTLILAVIVLMAPLPLVPFANTLPAIGIILLCLGIAERDGALVLLGYGVSLLAALYVGGLLWIVIEAGSDPQAAFEVVLDTFHRVTGH